MSIYTLERKRTILSNGLSYSPAAHQRRGFSHADVLPPPTKHRHDLTKMTPTSSATSRTWSARHALPPSCSSARYPLPLPTQTQNGSQGRFCAKEGHIKNDHLPAANSRRGHGGVYLSALYTNKKRRRIFPYGCLSAGCVRFLYSLLSALSASSALSVSSVSSASYHIWYGGQQADNRQGALRICCPP